MNAEPRHASLAVGKWFALTFAEQMGNIGSEVRRAVQWQEQDPQIFNRAIDNMLELIDMTILDARWRGRLKEILRVREFLCDAAFGEKTYGTLDDFDTYFLQFAIMARNGL
ncbi:MAG: hypothetical protein HY007_03990 [Candidatus Sungbacteria bacterium]|nr:hypothetical protein [Candidatus Sungbacteria bacterium]